MTKSLLKKAKSIKATGTTKRTTITAEHVELVFAFLRKEVSLTETSKALGFSAPSNGVYAVIVRTLQHWYENEGQQEKFKSYSQGFYEGILSTGKKFNKKLPKARNKKKK